MASDPITTPEAAVCAALETIAQLNGRVYPLEGLKSAAAPFAFYHRQQWEAEETLSGATALEEALFAVHLVTETYAELVALGDAAREKLRALAGTQYDGLLIERAVIRQTSPDIREKEVDLYRRMYVLQLNYQKEDISNG